MLVIEDEPLIALDLELALSSAGAAVELASTVASALEAAGRRRSPPPLLISASTGNQSEMSLRGSGARPSLYLLYRPDRNAHGGLLAERSPLLVKPTPAGEVVDMLARIVSAKGGRISFPNEKDSAV